jgi:hypothetical protein
MKMDLRYLGTALLICIALLMLCAALGAQSFSQILSFQGRLADADTGKPLTDGQYQVTFKIYDAEMGGNNLWTETQTVVQVGGVFNAYLGSVTPFPGNLFADGDRWLSLQVSGDPEMTERFRFTPSPWALYAATSGPDDDWKFSGDNIYRETGNVGIGTTAPGNALHVVSGGERAVFGDATAGSGTNYGVYGRLASTAGTGVYGEATATTGTANGVVGFTGTLEGSGVFGQNTNQSGDNEGVFGVAWSSEGKGVSGYNGASFGDAVGVFGRTASSTGLAVYGEAQTTSGSGIGVYGVTHSPYGGGVVGTSDDGGDGVYGYSEAGVGVMGAVPHDSSRMGMLGGIELENGGVMYIPHSGVCGSAEDWYGVSGRTLSGVSVYGETESGTGVEAYNEESGTQAELATSTHAAYFEGDVHTTDEYTKAYTPGTASLATPIAYATIDRTTGGVLVGTPNVSSTWNATYSRYEITISGVSYNFNTYVTTVTPIGGDFRATTDAVSGMLLVKVYDSSGTAVQRWFSFVTYKP